MATKGIFFIVYLHIEHNKIVSMEVLGDQSSPYHSAKDVQEDYDLMVRKTPPSNKHRIQIVQFVST